MLAHHWNGSPASADQLAFLALHNYGNYTFLQVRRNTVLGLTLHVERLRANAEELFGAAPTAEHLRNLLRAAVPPGEPCSVRVTVVSRDVDAVLAGAPVEPDVVVTVADPRQSSTAPITVRTVGYERDTPWVKHRATHALVRHTRQARLAGFDDALFLDRAGLVSEGTTWNACLRRDGTWIWPQAEVLQGVTLQLLRRAMEAAGIAQETRPVPASDLPSHQVAFALNATSLAKPIAAVDGHAFTGDGAAAVQLEALWASITREPL